MSMISLLFIAFSGVLCIVLIALEKVFANKDNYNKATLWVLLLASYAFVSYADLRFGVVLLILTISTWLFAKIHKNTIGVIIAVIALVFFKYMNFFAESFASIFGKNFVALKLIIPIGISFYSFSAISYLVDTKREKTRTRSFPEVALYLSFFPKLTSGPIQRSDDFFSQLDKPRHISAQKVSEGVQIFAFGLFKKLVIADHLSVFVDQVYGKPMAFNGLTIFFAAIAYSLQIYFDFSGYSDMAVGVAKTIGFDLPRNFNLPYISHNVTEFWKRWHISLSSWLQEYLYISLGGSRKGNIRTYINLMLTMVIGGVWHGANWTYVIWGFLHGIALVIHKVWMKKTNSSKKEQNIVARSASILATFLFTTLCWIFFRAESFSQASLIISRILNGRDGLLQPYTWLFFSLFILVVCTVFAYVRSKKINSKPNKMNISFIEGYYPTLNMTKFWHIVAFFIFIGLLLCLAHSGGSPFIYGKY